MSPNMHGVSPIVLYKEMDPMALDHVPHGIEDKGDSLIVLSKVAGSSVASSNAPQPWHLSHFPVWCRDHHVSSCLRLVLHPGAKYPT